MAEDDIAALCDTTERELSVRTNEVDNRPSRSDTPVAYCQLCTLPVEYCEYGGMWKECQKLHQESTEVADNTVASEDTSNASVHQPSDDKILSEIQLSVHKRGKHKLVTQVKGMGPYFIPPSTRKKNKTDLCNDQKEIEVKLVEISKDLKKVLCCGSCVSEGQVEFQGDVIDRLLEEIPKRYGEKYGMKFDRMVVGKREKFR